VGVGSGKCELATSDYFYVVTPGVCGAWGAFHAQSTVGDAATIQLYLHFLDEEIKNFLLLEAKRFLMLADCISA